MDGEQLAPPASSVSSSPSSSSSSLSPGPVTSSPGGNGGGSGAGAAAAAVAAAVGVGAGAGGALATPRSASNGAVPASPPAGPPGATVACAVAGAVTSVTGSCGGQGPPLSVYDRQTVQAIQQALHRQPSTAAQYLQQMYAAQQQHIMLQTASLQQQQQQQQQQHLSSAQLQSLAAVQQLIGRPQAVTSAAGITQQAVLLGSTAPSSHTANHMYLQATQMAQQSTPVQAGRTLGSPVPLSLQLIFTPAVTTLQPEVTMATAGSAAAQVQNLALRSQQAAVSSSSSSAAASSSSAAVGASATVGAGGPQPPQSVPLKPTAAGQSKPPGLTKPSGQATSPKTGAADEGWRRGDTGSPSSGNMAGATRTPTPVASLPVATPAGMIGAAQHLISSQQIPHAQPKPSLHGQLHVAPQQHRPACPGQPPPPPPPPASPASQGRPATPHGAGSASGPQAPTRSPTPQAVARSPTPQLQGSPGGAQALPQPPLPSSSVTGQGNAQAQHAVMPQPLALVQPHVALSQSQASRSPPSTCDAHHHHHQHHHHHHQQQLQQHSSGPQALLQSHKAEQSMATAQGRQGGHQTAPPLSGGTCRQAVAPAASSASLQVQGGRLTQPSLLPSAPQSPAAPGRLAPQPQQGMVQGQVRQAQVQPQSQQGAARQGQPAPRPVHGPCSHQTLPTSAPADGKARDVLPTLVREQPLGQLAQPLGQLAQQGGYGLLPPPQTVAMNLQVQSTTQTQAGSSRGGREEGRVTTATGSPGEKRSVMRSPTPPPPPLSPVQQPDYRPDSHTHDKEMDTGDDAAPSISPSAKSPGVTTTTAHLADESMDTTEEAPAPGGTGPESVAAARSETPRPPQAIVKPHILTHVIEGFVIQEGAEPFPVSSKVGRSSLMVEKSDKGRQPAPPGSTPFPSDDKSPPGPDSSDSDMEGLREMGGEPGREVDMIQCEFCRKIDFAFRFRRSKRFCSMACAKRYNVGCSKHVGLFGPAQHDHVSQRRERTGQRGRQRRSAIHPLARTHSMRQPVAGGGVGSGGGSGSGGGDDRPGSEQPHADRASSPCATVAMTTRRRQSEREREMRDLAMTEPSEPHGERFSHEIPSRWSVEQVWGFIHSLPGCQEVADEFRAQEIDGQALLLLKEDHLMSAMNLKLGPALKICARINLLKDA